MRPFVCCACKETHRAPTNLAGEEYCTECAIALIDKLGDNHPTVILAFAKWDIEIENALNDAWEEGRLHPDIAAARGVETGEHECPVCGMRHWTDLDSQQCCLPGLRALERMDEAQRLAGPTDLPVVVNAALLRAALAGKAGCTGSHKIGEALGIGHNVIYGLSRNGTRPVRATWEKLVAIFGGDIPGIEGSYDH